MLVMLTKAYNLSIMSQVASHSVRPRFNRKSLLVLVVAVVSVEDSGQDRVVASNPASWLPGLARGAGAEARVP